MAATKKRRTKKKEDSSGLKATELVEGQPPPAVRDLAEAIADGGGVTMGMYRDPLAGEWLILAGLPLARVEPTPYQRDLSKAHVMRLADAIDKLGRFLDPIIVVRQGEKFWTPNGHHRLNALKRLGARSVTALVVPDPEVAHRILILNTEKAHGLKERALEVIRLAEALAKLDDRPEAEYEVEFEEPSLLTLGICYDRNPKLAGATYHAVLKRLEGFMDEKLSKALVVRRARAKKVMQLDEAVGKVVDKLKAIGFQSPYLRPFVVARINPLRFQRGKTADFDETMDTMIEKAKKFDVSKVRAGQISGGGSSD